MGSAWAATELGKGDVNSKIIKNKSVKGADLKNDGATGRDVDESTLGEVPSAASADSADTANTAGSASTAGNSDLLDGQDSSAFLGVNGKAADANTLDGKDSSEFLGSTAKAADAQLLDGRDSLDLPRFAGSVSSTGTVSSENGGVTAMRLTTGQYFVNFPAGSFGPSSSGSCTVPIAVVTPTTGSLRFAAIAGTQCTPDGSGAGGFTVETYAFDAVNSEIDQVDAPFNFMAR